MLWRVCSYACNPRGVKLNKHMLMQVDTALPTALKNGWPDSQWWLEYHDNQLTSLINNALQNAPDMQVAEQRIQLWLKPEQSGCRGMVRKIDGYGTNKNVSRRVNRAVYFLPPEYERVRGYTNEVATAAGWHADVGKESGRMLLAEYS